MNNLSNMTKVAIVGGEGIGPEVTAQSHRVLAWFANKRNVPVVMREAQYGIIPYLATGKVLPPDTVEAMEEADAILWGATGGPETKEVPAAARKAGFGKVTAAGPFLEDNDLRGIFVFKTASVEEANELTNTDPAVQAERLRIELYSWTLPAEAFAK